MQAPTATAGRGPTVGEVVDCVADSVRRRQAAEAAKRAAKKRAAEPRGPAVSMGIRPPAVGGIENHRRNQEDK